jgi:membrane-bound inhibitor of C-type lysozyme
MLSRKRKSTRFLAAGIATIVIAGGTLGIVSAASSGGSSAAATVATTTAGVGAHPGGFSGPSGSGGGGSNARSGPAAGGSIGTVSSLSGSGFTLVTSAGQKATVKETSSTTYEHGTTPASASAVNDGETALVLGTTDSTTITATQVITQPAPGGSDASSQVVPFKRGASSTSKTVGQIPSNYKQGSGAIVSGATANKATEAALAAYPGGIVDRFVRLSNGEYEVHNIGVNWPHHIFVNTDFKVVGAD